MSSTFTTKAIILFNSPFREYDVRVVAYTMHNGKLELVARGLKKIKSKLAGHLEPMCLSEIMIARGKHFDYIASARNDSCYFNIKNNLEKTRCAWKALNLINQLTKHNEGRSAKAVFNLLKEYLLLMNNELRIKNYELWNSFFMLQLFTALGYKPELYNCVVCQNKILPNNNKFDFLKGGLVCGKCASSALLKISDDCIKILRLMVNSGFQILNRLTLNQKLIQEILNIIIIYEKHYQ